MTAFKISFDGPSVENGEIEISELAPALLALNELFTSANEALNEDGTKSSLKLKATDTGSFEAVLSLDVNTVENLWNLASKHKEDLQLASHLIAILIGGGTIAGSFFVALRFLKGRLPDKSEKLKNGNISITISGGSIEISPEINTLIEDLKARKAAKELVEKSFKSEGIDSVSIWSSEHAQSPELEITKTDREATSIPESLGKEELFEQTREVHLKIVSAHFEGNYLWRFSDGNKTFTASVEDQEFLKRLDNNEVSLSKDDVLLCEIVETQKIKGTDLKASVQVTKVIKHVFKDEQLRLL